jgi:hypothetical protein
LTNLSISTAGIVVGDNVAVAGFPSPSATIIAIGANSITLNESANLSSPVGLTLQLNTTTLSANGGATSGNGGSITVNNSGGGVSLSSGTISAFANTGSGGTVTLTGRSGPIQTGTGAINVNGGGAGINGGGNISVSGAGIQALSPTGITPLYFTANGSDQGPGGSIVVNAGTTAKNNVTIGNAVGQLFLTAPMLMAAVSLFLSAET